MQDRLRARAWSLAGLSTAAALSVAACSGDAGPAATAAALPTAGVTARESAPALLPTDAAAGATPQTVSPGGSEGTPGAPASPGIGVVVDEPWAIATLTDVTTGQSFRITDLVGSGKVVFVETMAIWCSNCRTQQRAAVDALAGLDPSTVEWIGVDVESSETPEALARYSQENGFPFRYAVADQALARALADRFGDIVLSPPSVNVIVVGTSGNVTHLTGHHDPEEIVTLAAEHRT